MNIRHDPSQVKIGFTIKYLQRLHEVEARCFNVSDRMGMVDMPLWVNIAVTNLNGGIELEFAHTENYTGT